ncbi:hypothetical protein ACFWJT_23830 [Streptomyces sp. NPDC127069]|uniref:hypothetical protein n=1 Tax=Streptomyces sp. NPDC127069 TaxID=3347128 RepID=UPI003660366F
MAPMAVPPAAAAVHRELPPSAALVRRELPEEKWVRVVEFAGSLPRTRSGKVRRAGLKGRGRGRSSGWPRCGVLG